MYKKLVMLILLMPFAYALEHSFVVEENGNALAILEIEGDGVINIQIPTDVQEMIVKGGLYFIENSSASIWMTGAATAIYRTAMLTSKADGVWSFTSSIPFDGDVTVSMPSEAKIVKTTPNAKIMRTNFTKLIWEDVGHVQVVYKFPEVKTKTANANPFPMFFGLAMLALFAIFIGKLVLNKRSKKPEVIKTLTANERKIVNIMLESGAIKRAKLEKKSKLAKSSLANTLNNLERKKIIMIDKTYVAHTIKFTRWFDEL